MIARSLQGSRPDWLSVWGGPLALCAISALLLFAPAEVNDLFAYQRAAIAAGQWWRLVTDNFVHLGFWHWLFNALSLVLWGFLCPRRLRARDWVLRMLLIGSGMSLGLYWLTPSLHSYVGLSGVIYGLFLLDLGHYALGGDRIAWACIVFLVVRVSWEWVAGAPASEVRLLGGAVVPQSHVWGMLAAVLYGLAAAAFRRRFPQWAGER